MADRIAKDSYKFPSPYQLLPIPKSFRKHLFKREILDIWQNNWNQVSEKGCKGLFMPISSLAHSLIEPNFYSVREDVVYNGCKQHSHIRSKCPFDQEIRTQLAKTFSEALNPSPPPDLPAQDTEHKTSPLPNR
ncbi:hypothetical protein LAZ67_6003709 [Cordylochernes scorpioides]|uniref:Uncharacterized protein n=1 Tax=Cordylochernes scorpioides TaxID=51811 RepID=A0ABY6KPF8_9ARAC|nr:hypothetical protein LAZ67_6003709 [Cordylochernes scorpioides]